MMLHSSESTPNDFQAPPGSLFEKLDMASDEIESLAGKPHEQASCTLRMAAWIVGDLRRDLQHLEKDMERFESQLRIWSSKIRESLTNIENAKSNEPLRENCPNGMLSPAATAKRLGVSRSALTSLTRDERFPQPIYVSPSKIAYIALEIDKWMLGSTS